MLFNRRDRREGAESTKKDASLCALRLRRHLNCVFAANTGLTDGLSYAAAAVEAFPPKEGASRRARSSSKRSMMWRL